MATNCKKCGFLKFTPTDKCACNPKKINGDTIGKKKTPKPIARIWQKKKERLKTQGSEVQIFKKVFKSHLKHKSNFCIICNKKITEEYLEKHLTPLACFPHILNKKDYPQLRYMPANLQFLTCWIEHHNKLDEIIVKIKTDIWLIELENIILSNKAINIEPYLV